MLKKLLVLALGLFILAGCSEKPWEEMTLDEKVKAFSNLTYEEKEAKWKSLPSAESDELYGKLPVKDQQQIAIW